MIRDRPRQLHVDLGLEGALFELLQLLSLISRQVTLVVVLRTACKLRVTLTAPTLVEALKCRVDR